MCGKIVGLVLHRSVRCWFPVVSNCSSPRSMTKELVQFVQRQLLPLLLSLQGNMNTEDLVSSTVKFCSLTKILSQWQEIPFAFLSARSFWGSKLRFSQLYSLYVGSEPFKIVNSILILNLIPMLAPLSMYLLTISAS